LKKQRNRIHGWVVVDKALGTTSTQVVGRLRWLFNAEKAGHGGTLDPLATGLLPIALGESTKTVNYVMDDRKTYRFAVRWGAETSTDDLEGYITNTYCSAAWDDVASMLRNMSDAAMQQSLQQILPRFIGAVQQRPPAYSAIKVAGKRAYDLARAGEGVTLAERTIQIDDLRVTHWRFSSTPHPATASLPAVRRGREEGFLETVFEVDCGKGTYVRSLARDLGRATGWLGHVTELRRIRVGPFGEADAISLEKLEELSHRPDSENILAGFLRPIETVLDGIPALAVMDPDAQRLRQGQVVLLRGSEAPAAAEVVLALNRGHPVGLCSLEQGMLKPKRLFNF
jgi:tRNA pseudouridine55 synthase